jgi:hypothetical protein
MALEAGLLTLGSSYWPTPSQWSSHWWRLSLAFIPNRSGASVRELHPLPNSSTPRAVTANIDIPDLIWSRRGQAHGDAVVECIRGSCIPVFTGNYLPAISLSIGTIHHVCYGQLLVPAGDSMAVSFWHTHVREAKALASGESYVQPGASKSKPYLRRGRGDGTERAQRPALEARIHHRLWRALPR